MTESMVENIIAFAVPALAGAIAGYVLGHREVRALRQRTGDDSLLAKLLSGDFAHRGAQARLLDAALSTGAKG